MNSFSPALLLMLLFLSVISDAVAGDYADEDDYDDESLPYVEIKGVYDFFELSEQAYDSNKIIMLEMSAYYCDYCRLLEEEIIKPMLRSKDYTDTVLIRQIKVDSNATISDFDGYETTPVKLADAYKIQVTPTLFFLDSNGNEVAGRMLGVNSLDLYGDYIDQALKKGLQSIR